MEVKRSGISPLSRNTSSYCVLCDEPQLMLKERLDFSDSTGQNFPFAVSLIQ